MYFGIVQSIRRRGPLFAEEQTFAGAAGMSVEAQNLIPLLFFIRSPGRPSAALAPGWSSQALWRCAD